MKFIAGNTMASLATYVLFLAFAYGTSADALGYFAVLSACAGILVVVLDTLITQRVLQDSNARRERLSDTHRVLVRFVPARLLLTLLLGFFAALVFGLFSGEYGLAGGAFVMMAGQTLYTILTTTQSLAGSASKFVVAQAMFTASALVLALLFSVFSNEASALELLLVMGAARIIPGLWVVVSLCRHRSAQGLGLSALWKIMVSGASRRRSASLLVLHLANAAASNADTIVAGSAGLATAGQYQLAQRPMLGLSVLNVSIGQVALRRFLSGQLRLKFRYLLFIPVIMIVWPSMGLFAGLVVAAISPPSISIPLLVFVLLGLGFAFGAVAAVTGPLLLLRGSETALMVGGLIHLLTLVVVGLSLVSDLELAGIAIAVLASKAAVVAVHLLALGIPTSRTP